MTNQKRNTRKSRMLDYIENANRPMSWTELHDFYLADSGDWPRPAGRKETKKDFRGHGASYFSETNSYLYGGGYMGGPNRGGILMRPSRWDNRYLRKDPVTKLYHLVKAEF